jgi:hypothetical protein
LIFLSFVFILTALPSTAILADAKTDVLKDEIPSYLRIRAGSACYDQIRIKLVDYDCRITGLKSSSKNLKLCITQSTHYKKPYGTGSYMTEYWIGTYAIKEGNYKVTFNLKKGSKVQKKTIRIFAYNDAPFKSITFAGQKIDVDNNPSRMTSKKEGVFKAVMNKGYKLTRIQKLVVVKNDTDWADEYSIASNQREVFIRNGARTKLSDRVYSYTYKGKTTKKSMLSQTIFKIYYIDKHTKKEETKSVGVYYLKD